MYCYYTIRILDYTNEFQVIAIANRAMGFRTAYLQIMRKETEVFV